MSESDIINFTNLSGESIKIIAERMGIGKLSDDATKKLANDVSYRLKLIIQDGANGVHRGQSQTLTTCNIDQSCENIQPICRANNNPFTFAPSRGRKRTSNLKKGYRHNYATINTAAKVPLETTISGYLLAMDGVEPTIPKKSPVSKKVEPIDLLGQMKKVVSHKRNAYKLHIFESVYVKQLAKHELSAEQQAYYREITTACIGPEEEQRIKALQGLASNPGVHNMLPHVCAFIAIGVKVNVVDVNMALLIFYMRMVKALLENKSLYLEKHLHDIIPTVVTCIVSKKLCKKPENDNHWALRDFASGLISLICKKFNTSTNNIQKRLMRIFYFAVIKDKSPLSTLYGGLSGLVELGNDVIELFVLPKVKYIAERMHLADCASDKLCCSYIRHLLVNGLTPLLVAKRPPPDRVQEYRKEYGSVGWALFTAVAKARWQAMPPGTAKRGRGRPRKDPTKRQGLPSTRSNTQPIKSVTNEPPKTLSQMNPSIGSAQPTNSPKWPPPYKPHAQCPCRLMSYNPYIPPLETSPDSYCMSNNNSFASWQTYLDEARQRQQERDRQKEQDANEYQLQDLRDPTL